MNQVTLFIFAYLHLLNYPFEILNCIETVPLKYLALTFSKAEGIVYCYNQHSIIYYVGVIYYANKDRIMYSI